MCHTKRDSKSAVRRSVDVTFFFFLRLPYDQSSPLQRKSMKGKRALLYLSSWRARKCPCFINHERCVQTIVAGSNDLTFLPFFHTTAFILLSPVHHLV